MLRKLEVRMSNEGSYYVKAYYRFLFFTWNEILLEDGFDSDTGSFDSLDAAKRFAEITWSNCYPEQEDPLYTIEKSDIWGRL